MTRLRIRTTFLVWSAVFILAACSTPTTPPIDTPQVATATGLPASDTPAPTLTYTPMPTPTTIPATLEPSATPEPTQALTPTPAASATLIPTPTRAMVQPGIYNTGGCNISKIETTSSGEIDFELCVLSVEVNFDYHMIFTISWKATKLSPGSTYTKASGKADKGIYLVDNLDNRYDPINAGGSAYKEVKLENNKPITGWFEFGKVEPYAVNFTFYDEAHDITIKGIPLAFPTIVFETWDLRNTPLQLRYSSLKWALGSLPDGSQGLIHQKVEGCSIQEVPSRQPQGDLYNRSMEIGEATYAIYGAIDAATNRAFREYVVIGGPELTQAGQALFHLSIPLDDSTICIFDASDVLSKLDVRK